MFYSNENYGQPYNSMLQTDEAVDSGYANDIVYGVNLNELPYQSRQRNSYLHVSRDTIDYEFAYQSEQNRHTSYNDRFNESSFDSYGYICDDTYREDKLAVLQTTHHSHVKHMKAKPRYDDEPTNSDNTGYGASDN